jgi:hypothetical protein
MGSHEVRWVFHSTAMVSDYVLAVERLQKIAGLRVMEYGELEQPEIGRRGGMTWLGDNSIEIGATLPPYAIPRYSKSASRASPARWSTTRSVGLTSSQNCSPPR